MGSGLSSVGVRERKGALPLMVAASVAIVVSVVVAWQAAVWPFNQHSERALARRAQHFWDLKIAGDTLGAYAYMADVYRRRVTPIGFKNEGGGAIVHTGAKVAGVRLDEKGGVVDIDLKHVYNKPHYSDLELSSRVSERWVFENGAWYRWPPGFLSNAQADSTK